MSLAYQTFEHGLMIWVGVEQTILVIFEPSGNPAWVARADAFVEGMRSEDPALVPPPGRFQPVRGFGLLWRTDRSLQTRLGWATNPELGYTGFTQVDVTTGVRYVQGPGGEIYVLPADQLSWGQIVR